MSCFVIDTVHTASVQSDSRKKSHRATSPQGGVTFQAAQKEKIADGNFLENSIALCLLRMGSGGAPLIWGASDKPAAGGRCYPLVVAAENRTGWGLPKQEGCIWAPLSSRQSGPA